MGREVTQHPTAAVKEHKGGERAAGVFRFHYFQFYRLAIYLDRFFRNLSGRQFCALLRANQYLAGLLRGHLFHWLTLAGIQNIKKRLYACGRGRGIGGLSGCRG